MLDRLRAAGVQLAVLTNKDHVSAAPLIEKYFGPDRFALVQGRVDAVSAQARGARHTACDGRARRRSGNHALRRRFECRCSDRPQRRP
ncbi:MAG: hypothetical protein ACLU0O_05865 [Collinsella sp.]